MKLSRRLRRFGAATKGLAALEFAIIAPMMIFVMFASVDLLDLLVANKRAENTAASLADVVSRDTEISNAEIAGIWSAADVLMFPENADNMQIRVTSITVLNAATAQVVWSEGHNMAPRGANSTVPLPAGMMTPGTSVIMTETVMPYSTPLGFLTAAPVQITHDAYRRSRLVDPIPRVA